jgi:hypothetical protein
MAHPAARPNRALEQFVEDELLRATLLIDQTVESAVDALRREMGAMNPRERMVASDLQRGVLGHRPAISRAFVESLRTQIATQIADAVSTRGDLPSMPAALSLVDEAEVEVDVEMSRVIETIRSVGETELRELQTYTSALVGDMDVASDYNPFRPETMARALWDGVEALPMARAYQLALIRAACMPFAQMLRKSYAGACSRLESTGVEPAVYRTIILPGGSRRAQHQQDAFFDPALNRVQGSSGPAPTAAGAARAPIEQVLVRADELLRNLSTGIDRHERDRLRLAQHQMLIGNSQGKVDRELIDLLARLFDNMLGDRRLAADIQNVVARLQAPALRVALRDPSVLDNYTHPLWLLMDRLAAQGDTHPESGQPERIRVLQFMHGLIDSLVQEQARDADAFRWALDRVQGYERLRLERRLKEAVPECERLQEIERRVAGAAFAASTTTGALDIGHLETVPAELLDKLPPDRLKGALDASAWIDARRPGDWVRMFTQGGRVHAQLLWTGDQGDISLFADTGATRTWAVRRRALDRLYSEKLLSLLQPRMLLRDAAERLLQTMTSQPKG